MKNIVTKLMSKARSLPKDLPLCDITAVKEYIGTAGSYWRIYRARLTTNNAVSLNVSQQAPLRDALYMYARRCDTQSSVLWHQACCVCGDEMLSSGRAECCCKSE